MVAVSLDDAVRNLDIGDRRRGVTAADSDEKFFEPGLINRSVKR